MMKLGCFWLASAVFFAGWGTINLAFLRDILSEGILIAITIVCAGGMTVSICLSFAFFAETIRQASMDQEKSKDQKPS